MEKNNFMVGLVNGFVQWIGEDVDRVVAKDLSIHLLDTLLWLWAP